MEHQVKTSERHHLKDNELVRVCTWTLCAWRRESFVRSLEQSGAGVLSGRVGFFPQPSIAAFRVGGDEDVRYAEILLRGAELGPAPRIAYDSAQQLGSGAPRRRGSPPPRSPPP